MLEVVETERLTAQQFKDTPRSELKEVRFVRMPLGKGFGAFEVTYKTPKIKEVNYGRSFHNFATKL